MTEKVKITQEQADAIEKYKSNGHKLKEFVVHGERGFHGYYEPLKGLPIDDMARLLYEPDSYEIEPMYKVGDEVIYPGFGGGEIVVKIIAIQYEHARVQFEELSNWKAIRDIVRHATPEEVCIAEERKAWAKVEPGDVLIGKKTGRYAALLRLHPEHGMAEVLLWNGHVENWDIAACVPYAKKVGDINA